MMDFRIQGILFMIIVLLNAMVLMGLLLDVRIAGMDAARRAVFVGAAALIAGGNLLALFEVGAENLGKYYMLIAQLPVFLLFLYFSKRGWGAVLFATLTAIFLTFPLMMGRLVVSRLLNNSALAMVAMTVAVCALTFFFVLHFLKPNFVSMLEHAQSGSMARFCIVPFFYNMISYSMGKYNYTANMPVETLASRILLFLMTLAVYFLLLDLFKTTREKEKAQSDQELLFLQLKASRQRMDELKSTQEQMSYYRHDMRHHLTLIGGYLADGDMVRLRQYLLEVQRDIDEISFVQYCENETVNLILSSFSGELEKRGVVLSTKIVLTNQIPIGDTELCALLSNALENAVSAAGAVGDGRNRRIRVECRMTDGKLLILVENPYEGEVIMENGMPKSRRAGHGFGTKSMISIVEKHGGIYSFDAKNGIFTVRIVI